MASLPNYCTAGQEIWCAQVPLICFHIIEWHSTDRVMRQFGFEQTMPRGSDVDLNQHKIRDKEGVN